MVNSIHSDLLLSSVQKREVKTGNDILGKDDFLKILMVQLQNQDPMNPMEDKEFIAQMATFSSLEQMTNMSQSMEKLVELQTQTSLIAYQQLIGKEVTWHTIDDHAESGEISINEGKGIVKTVQFMGDTVKIILTDGKELAPANVSELTDTAVETPLIQASLMIGKQISWLNDDQEFSSIVQSVSMKDGFVTLMTNDGQEVKTSQLIKIS
ncbi:flagellar hook assembly protein FlgD [Bacillus sp. FJAT-50079]|uniref:flagellar hook assembly protein FlgD n=1 Tax=Bacillus sp. FJAT-50079 TaxID=2833577 RepID=UPI001BC910A3|nr:flagellar hook assembly protein FlgD [Bacillus sp. FJAT-50079]MBS4207620.1 flagellar hook assembly protein FlgD [Bacillus sp. FJAT-50079]